MKIATWNMGGAVNKWQENLPSIISENDLDVICLQECGTPKFNSTAAETLNVSYPPAGMPLSGKWKAYSWTPHHTEYYVYWCNPNDTKNLAIITKTRPSSRLFIPNALNGRDAIGVCLHSISIYTVHGFSSKHAAATGGQDIPGILQEAQKNAPVVVMGDVNCDPELMEQRLKKKGINMPTSSTGNATRPQSKSELDYAFAQGLVVEPIGMKDSSSLSDHNLLIYRVG
jgi:exonuclease III